MRLCRLTQAVSATSRLDTVQPSRLVTSGEGWRDVSKIRDLVRFRISYMSFYCCAVKHKIGRGFYTLLLQIYCDSNDASAVDLYMYPHVHVRVRC